MTNADLEKIEKRLAVLQEAAMRVDCPRCAAPAGEPCLVDNTETVHVARAIAAMEEGETL